MSSPLKRQLRLEDVMDILNTKKSKIYSDIKNNGLPAPIKVGRSSYWIAEEIAQWQQERIAERDAKVQCKAKATQNEDSCHE